MDITPSRPLAPLAYTVAEACEVMRLGRNTVLELLYSGQLRAIRVGRRWVIPRAAIEDFLNGNNPAR
jgi:excisionase family DNA binding protein